MKFIDHGAFLKVDIMIPRERILEWDEDHQCDSYCVSKTFNHFLHIPRKMDQLTVIEVKRGLIPSVRILIKLLLAEGASTVQKHIMLDHTKAFQACLPVLNALPHEDYYNTLKSLLQNSSREAMQEDLLCGPDDYARIQNMASSPRKLVHISRLAVYQNLTGNFRLQVQTLKLPSILKEYLLNFYE